MIVQSRVGAFMASEKSTILSFPSPAERGAILDNKRVRKMAQSAHAFVRGSTAQFYDWLASADRGEVPSAPSVLDLRRLPCR